MISIINIFYIKAIIYMAVIGIHPNYNFMYENKVLSGYKICVDAGHGGQIHSPCYVNNVYTGGTTGICTNQTESDVNLDVAYYLYWYLSYFGADVCLTRYDRCKVSISCNKSDELSERNKIAEVNNSQIFISIHHNEGKNKEANYGIVFFNEKHKLESEKLGRWVSYYINKHMQVVNAGVKSASYSVLKNSKIPAILVEASFLSNCQEDLRLATCEYKQKEAFGIAMGVTLYFLCDKYNIALTPMNIKDLFKNKTVIKKDKETKKKIYKKSKKHSKLKNRRIKK